MQQLARGLAALWLAAFSAGVRGGEGKMSPFPPPGEG